MSPPPPPPPGCVFAIPNPFSYGACISLWRSIEKKGQKILLALRGLELTDFGSTPGGHSTMWLYTRATKKTRKKGYFLPIMARHARHAFRVSKRPKSEKKKGYVCGVNKYAFRVSISQNLFPGLVSSLPGILCDFEWFLWDSKIFKVDLNCLGLNV